MACRPHLRPFPPHRTRAIRPSFRRLRRLGSSAVSKPMSSLPPRTRTGSISRPRAEPCHDSGGYGRMAGLGGSRRCLPRAPLITTYPVLVECVHLMFSRIGVAKTLGWVETVGTKGVGVFVMGADHLPRLTALMHQYADLPMDLADASIV